MKLYLTTFVLIAMACQAEASQKGLRKGRNEITEDAGVKDAGEKQMPGKPNEVETVKQAEKDDKKDKDKVKKNKDTQEKKKSGEDQKGPTKEEKGKREDKNDVKTEKDAKTNKDKGEKTVGEKNDKEKENVDKEKKDDKEDQDTKNVDNEEDTEDAVTEHNVAPADSWFPVWMRPCKYLEQQFNDNVECDVSIIRSFLARREIVFAVKASEPICDPLNMVCATPTFSGGVNFKDVMVESGFGFNDVTVLNQNYGNIDFDLDVCMSEQDDGDVPDTPTSTNTTSNATETEMDTSKMQTEEAFANDEASFIEDSFLSQLSAPRVCACTASVLGQKCNSCKVCGNGGGFSFDCSNIIPLLSTNEECDGTLSFIRSLVGNGQKIIPQIPTILTKLAQNLL